MRRLPGLGSFKAREAQVFGLLVVCYPVYVLVCLLSDPEAERPRDVVVPGVLASVAYLGLGAWIWARLRRGRARGGAICWTLFSLAGATVSMGIAAAGMVDKPAHRVILGFDVLYLAWAFFTLGVLAVAPASRRGATGDPNPATARMEDDR